MTARAQHTKEHHTIISTTFYFTADNFFVNLCQVFNLAHKVHVGLDIVCLSSLFLGGFFKNTQGGISYFLFPLAILMHVSDSCLLLNKRIRNVISKPPLTNNEKGTQPILRN